MTVLLLGFVAFRPEATPVAQEAAATTAKPTIASVPVTLADADASFGSGAPWSLAVVGDSTGNDKDEWVYLTANRWAAETGRPVTTHNWSIESDSYEDSTKIPGTGKPITIWNASAAGMNTEYSLKHFADMAPKQPDLLIVNHGHNHSVPADGARGVDRLVRKAEQAWEDSPAVAVTLQNPRTDDRAKSHADLVERLRTKYEGTHVTLIDAARAFDAEPSITPLLRSDGFHPSPDGEVVWADAVKDDLGF